MSIFCGFLHNPLFVIRESLFRRESDESSGVAFVRSASTIHCIFETDEVNFATFSSAPSLPDSICHNQFSNVGILHFSSCGVVQQKMLHNFQYSEVQKRSILLND